jgi:hypothetical protein
LRESVTVITTERFFARRRTEAGRPPVTRKKAMVRSLIFVASVCAFSLLGGCGDHGGDIYLGKLSAPTRHTTLEIAKNGDNYLVADTHLNFFAGGVKTDKLPAVYKDGMLVIGTGLESQSLGYDKKKDVVLMQFADGTGELQRVK